eukprot:1864747-Amphidinium_carterae.1
MRSTSPLRTLCAYAVGGWLSNAACNSLRCVSSASLVGGAAAAAAGPPVPAAWKGLDGGGAAPNGAGWPVWFARATFRCHLRS